MSKLTAADKKILQRIRDKVAATHWIKHHYVAVRGPKSKTPNKEMHCLVGFINAETMPEEYVTMGGGYRTVYPSLYGGGPVPDVRVTRRNRLLDALMEAIQSRTGSHQAIEHFNDSKKTKRDDVLAVLDDLIGDKK